MERSPEATTHYEILEVSTHASSIEIKQAYRRLARKYHPDVNPDNPEAVELFQRISQSYRVLSDPEARARYDQRIGVDTFKQKDVRSDSSSVHETVRGTTAPHERSPEPPAPDPYADRSPTELYNEALRQTQLKRYERAIELFTATLRVQPMMAEAYAHRGYAHERLDQDSAAFANFSEAIQLNPNLAIAYYFRGLTRFKLGYSEAAIEDYSTSLDLNPDDAQALYRRGLAYADVSEPDRASADFKRAIRLFQAAGDRMMQLEVAAVHRRIAHPTSWRGRLKKTFTIFLRHTWNTALTAILNPIECGA